jgi:chaperonin GroES
MAEIDNNTPVQEDIVEEKEVDIEIESPTDEMAPEEETPEAPEDFYKNLAEDMDERVLARMANSLVQDYRQDKVSREDWEQTYTQGLDLLGFKYQEMTRPFQGASGVVHPLLAESVTQFQAQAYKELLPPEGPVRTQIVGAGTPEIEQQAERVQNFMNYMLMEKMEEYTPEFDQLLFYLPISGSTFKKIYYDEIMQRAVAKFVPAQDLVVPYYATDLKDCERITHIIKMSDNEVLKKQKAGFYRDVELAVKQPEESSLKQKLDNIEGVKPSGDKEFQHNILEMHVDLDLSEFENTASENKDRNIKVPYVVSIDEGSQEILSIYRNYSPDDELKTRKEYFVHYKFLPGLGFYGFGLIHMIGGLSRTATSALRQLLDAGTLANLPAGFKSRGIRIRDDDQPFQPGEFRDVDAPGGNIKDQFQILPFKEPSPTLFQLLGFVVNAGQRFASIADMQLGEDVANRAVGTTIALLERGSRVMSAIHKRIYYTMKQEFKLLAGVFADYLPPVYPYAVYGADRMVKVQDFDDRVDVIPVADPNIFSMAQRFTLAQTQLQIAQTNPQMHDLREAYRRVYEAIGVRQIDLLMPPPVQPQPQDPAVENARSLKMEMLQVFPDQDHNAHITAHASFMQSRMVQVNPMVYALLQGHISEHISFKAQGEIGAMVAESQEMTMMSQQDPTGFQIQFNALVANRVAELTAELIQAEGGSQQVDPLVALKQRELDLKAMDIQRRAQEAQQDMTRKETELEEKIDIERMKMENQEEQAAERMKVAQNKLKLQEQALRVKQNEPPKKG